MKGVFFLLTIVAVLFASYGYAQTYLVVYDYASSNDSYSTTIGVTTSGGGFTFGNTDKHGVREVVGRPTRMSASGYCPSKTVDILSSECIPGISGDKTCMLPYDPKIGQAIPMYYGGTLRIVPKMPLTSSLGPGTTFCPGTDLVLKAPPNFPVYSISVSKDMNTWTPLASSGNSSLTVNSSTIGASFLNTPVYFTCTGECGANYNFVTGASNVLGPFTFWDTFAPIADTTKFDVTPPSCQGSLGVKIRVNALSRVLTNNETIELSLFDAAAGVLKNKRGPLPLPIELGIDNLKFGAGKYKIETHLFVNGGDTRCPATTGTFTVKDTPKLISTPSASTAIDCNGNSTGAITITGGGGRGNYKYRLNNSTLQVSNVFTGLAAGTYDAYVYDFDDNLCLTKTSYTLTEPSVLKPGTLAVSTPISCHGKLDGVVSLTGTSGGTTPYQYKNNNSTYGSATVFSGLGPISYMATVTDAKGCTASSNTTTLNDPAALTGTFTPTNAVCNGGAGSMVITKAAGGTNSFSYSLDGGALQPTGTFSSIAAGSHQAIIQDGHGCQLTDAFKITEPAAIDISFLTTNVTCFGGADGSATITAGNGNTPYQYSLDGGAFVSVNAFAGLNSGSHTFIVKDSKGCTKSSNQTVPTNPVITGTFTNQSVRCHGESNGSIDLTPAGGVSPYSYVWSQGSTSQDLNNIGGGTYTVTVKDSKGCSKALNYSLVDPAAISVTYALSDYNGYNVSCAGSNNGSIDLTISGGTGALSSLWSNKATTTDLNGIVAGHYDVTITDAKSCSVPKGFDIIQPAALGITSGTYNNISCFGANDGSVSLATTGGVSTFQYSKNGTTWQTSNVFSSLPPASYTFQVRDKNNCLSSRSQIITTPAVLSMTSIDKNTSCGQLNGSSSVTVTGGTPSYNYNWYNSNNILIDTTASMTNVGAGVYRIDVKDTRGCLKTKTVAISSSNGPVVSTVSTTPVTCYESSDGKATISISKGQLPYGILWPTGETTTQGTGLTRGDQIVKVSDGTGCEVFYTVAIASPDELTLTSTTQQDPSCHDTKDGALTVVAQGGSGTYSYEWNTGETTTTRTGLGAGTYTLKVKDIKDCKTTAEYVLNNPEAFVIDLGADKEMCEGQQMQLGTYVANATFQWTSPTGFTSSDNLVNVNKPGTYTLVATDNRGCEATDAITLILNESLLKTDFLMIGEAHAGDSVILIDITWPVPSSTSWDFGSDANVIYSSPDWAVVTFDKEGVYTLGMSAVLASCTGYHSQQITILQAEESAEGGRKATNLLKEVIVYPNPSDGEFEVAIKLSELHAANVQLVSVTGNAEVLREELTGSDEYHQHYQLRVGSGVYFLIIKAGKESKIFRLMIQ